MAPRAYAFTREIANTGADRAVLQIRAPATIPLEIVRFSLSQLAAETSEQNAIEIVRMTTGATVTAAVIADDIRPLSPGDAASTVQVSTTATGYNASTAGTEATGGNLIREAFNWVGNGYLYLPVPEERIVVAADGILAFKTISAFTGTVEATLVFRELA